MAGRPGALLCWRQRRWRRRRKQRLLRLRGRGLRRWRVDLPCGHRKAVQALDIDQHLFVPHQQGSAVGQVGLLGAEVSTPLGGIVVEGARRLGSTRPIVVATEAVQFNLTPRGVCLDRLQRRPEGRRVVPRPNHVPHRARADAGAHRLDATRAHVNACPLRLLLR